MSSLLKNILFALVFAFILWLGYKLFFTSDDTSLATLNATVATEASRDTQEFLRTLYTLRDIQLNGEVLNDARFQSFVDYRQAIIDEPVGRLNPFAPVGR